MLGNSKFAKLLPEVVPVAKNMLSLGVGVQSSTLAAMAAMGLYPRPDFAVMGDTEGEPREVYEYLDYLTELVASLPHPFPIYRVSRGSLARMSARVRTSKTTGQTYLKHQVPAFVLRANGKHGMWQRACSLDFKIAPIRSLLIRAWKPPRGDRAKPIGSVWIGISTDELERVSTSPVSWIQHRWPLIELGMSRADCLAWMRAQGFRQPPRSSCSYCPYHSDAEWHRLKTQSPQAFQEAVSYELAIQKAASEVPRLDGKPFLHASRMPLSQVQFNPQEAKNHGECQGLCGV